MPLYDYDCSACGRRFEAIHGVYGDPPATCPLCGSGPVRKAIAAPAVHYKGSGWAKKERRAAPASSTSGSSEDGADGGSASTDDAAAPAKAEPASTTTKPAAGSTTTPSSTKTTD
jgi:putative FmdB family regulatory protein